MAKTSVVDSVIKELIQQTDNDDVNWISEKKRLRSMIKNGSFCNRQWALKLIDDHCGDNRDVKILDYGCGSGILNLLLLLKGYSHIHGVDVIEKFNDKILQNMNFNNASFKLIDAEDRLPFDDATFDIINSSLVLEHIENVDFYYSEAARVLKPGGICLFNFPHRLKPYDSHSRCWFIHYFPKSIRKFLWDIFARQSGSYLNNYLYLRTVSTHKRIARQYFSYSENITRNRIKTINFVNYKGNSKLRFMAAKLMNLKYVGKIFIKIFSINSSVDLYLVK